MIVKQENRDITSELLFIIRANDLVSCTIYARENNLLNEPRWKRFARLAKQEKKLLCLQN